MASWTYFDCDVMIGRSGVPLPDEILDAGALLKEMDRYGIEKALFYDRARNNARAVKEAAKSDRLEPCWVLPLELQGPKDKLEDNVDRMVEAGAKAARFLAAGGPSAPPMLIKPFLLSKVYERLEGHRIPLLLDGGELHTPAAASTYSLGDIDAICGGFPKLPVILLRTHRSLQTLLVLLMRKHANLFFTYALNTLFGQLEEVVAMAGAGRILYGSQMPYWDPSLPIGILNYAELTAAQKQLIAGENLRRLLANVR